MTTLQMPANMDVSNFLEKKGQYHAAVTSVEENPVDTNGKLVDGLKVVLSILAGTEADQAKREFTMWLNNPNMGHRDGGEFAGKVLARFALAVEILPKAAPGETVEIDWQNAIGRQLVVYIKERGENYTGFRLDGANVYAVDDPSVAHVPKDAAALRLIGKGELATTAATKPKAAAKQTKAKAQPAQQPLIPTVATDDDFGDL